VPFRRLGNAEKLLSPLRPGVDDGNRTRTRTRPNRNTAEANPAGRIHARILRASQIFTENSAERAGNIIFPAPAKVETFETF